MHDLSFRTRGNSDFKGKPKVFFTAHPDDFDLYFDLISTQILDLQNCSIWYFINQTGVLDEDDEFNLGTMNLFVVPVSGRYLTENSLSSEQIIPFAVEHHISVLPIMEEPGIDSLFQGKFKNMQYIIDDPSDVTAISYKEKLGNRLDAVFWGDELSGQIRSAFDAYIFMSYRKKDRKHAQELMRLIHKNSLCRDIAIWYDEFLVPGEDFSQSIEKALENSNLFALVVTPNLVNEDNYVKEIEYPMAIEKDKPVLPVEMVPTSPEKMESNYTGITGITSRDEEEQIYDRIKKLIPGILDAHKYDDPIHNFFMGLAYLSGIDVEVDRDLGVTRIKEAADAGLDEAIEKLVSMYFYGDGVGTDYDKALEWQRKITDKYGKIAEKSMKEADVIVYLRHLNKLAELSYKAEKYENAYNEYERLYMGGKLLAFGAVGKNIFGKMGNLFRKYTGHSECQTEALSYMLESSRMLLNISTDLGIFDRVQKWTKNAMTFAQAGYYASDDEKIVHSYRLTVGKLGEMCLESGNVQGAEIWFGKEYELIGNSSESDNSYTERSNCAICYKHMGSLRFFMKNYDEAILYDQKAAKEWNGLYSEFRDVNSLTHMIESYIAGAHVYASKKDQKNKMNVLNIARDVAEKSEFYDTIVINKLMALVDILTADIYMFEKRYDEAYSLYTSAVDVLTRDEDLFLKAEDLRNAGYACRKLGDYYFAKEEYDDAMPWYEDSYKHMADIVLFSKAISDVREYVDALEHLFRNGLLMGKIERSQEWIDKACMSAESIAMSTGLSSDIETKNRLFAMREQYLREKRLKSANKNTDERDSESSLSDYERKEISTISEKPKDEIEDYIENTVGKICLDFAETHPLFEGSRRINELGSVLTKDKYFTAGMSERRIFEKKYFLTGKIADVILGKLDTLKYDEPAMIILSFCGFYDLKGSKRVAGGKDKALEDFYRFYRQRVFWKYNISEVEFPGLWCYMTVWINTLVDENGAALKTAY